MAISKAKLDIIRPLLEGNGPNEKGWWAAYCPYHGDSTRSAGVNINEGFFKCHGCPEIKSIEELIADRDSWQLAVHASGGNGSTTKGKQAPTISEAQVEGWHSSLLSTQAALNELMVKRGLNIKSIQKYEIGWDKEQQAYTIPIRDLAGKFVNVRFYQTTPSKNRRKIWSVEGMGSPTLWPMDQLDYRSLVICEGEMDAILTIQNGIPAITRTGAADVWQGPAWSKLFAGKNVYICHDMDTKGQHANSKIAAAIRRYANTITIVTLPFPVTEDHGKDLTDFWMQGRNRDDFLNLIRKKSKVVKEVEPSPTGEPELVPIDIIDSFDAELVDHPLRMSVTVTGKRVPSYLIPESIVFNCDMGAGKRCDGCALSANVGQMRHKIEAKDPLILHLVNVPDIKMYDSIRKAIGITKCPRFTHTIEKFRTVEEIYVRPSVEDGPTNADQDFTHRKVISSASHDLTSNQSVILTGTIRPHPTNQANEFQAWKVDKPKTGLDKFEVSDEIRQEMLEFQSDDPLKKCLEIAEDLSVNHTFIYGRDDLHVFADLVFHSLLDVNVYDEREKKGWLDGIIFGDTRTGKSEVSSALIQLYNAGEMVSCEAATFAGVVGGLDRTGDNKWIVKWGVIPVNDRRIAVLDEVSGLKPEEIASMSDLRSSGTAKLTKIQNEQAKARTRLLWLGNPREGRMEDFAFGIDALRKLVINPEDIARFDMAMGVFSDDVSIDEINKNRRHNRHHKFSDAAYQAVLRWAWTRKRNDVVWEEGTHKFVRDSASAMGKVYIETPPLIQGADARMKIARIAAAFAARTYSTPDGVHVHIDHSHVQAAVDFLDRVYSHEKFGYKTVSKNKRAEAAKTEANMAEIMNYLASKPSLIRFLINSPRFHKGMVQQLMNMSDEEANMTLKKMWEMGALELSSGQLKVVPVVLNNLRGFIGVD